MMWPCLRTEKLALCEALKQVVESLQPQADDAKVGLQLVCTDSPRLIGDPDRLTQIFLNLARNAIEAAPPGSDVRLEVENTEDAGVIVVSVHNDGDPIPSEIAGQLFEPFFTTRPQGTGLGLAIVRRLTEAHGGSVTVTSAAGAGTTFRVRLPTLL